MAIQQHLYRLTKRAVDAVPPGLLRARPYGVYSVEVADHSPTTVDIDDPEGEWSFRWIENNAQLDSIAAIADQNNRSTWDGVAQRVAVAWRRHTGSDREQPIGLAWIATGRFCEQQLGICVELAPGQAWLHSAVVLPEWRNRRVYRALLGFVFDSLRREEIEQLLLGVSLGNVASLRSHQAAGAKGIGKIAAVRSLGVTTCLVRGAVHTRSGWPMVVGRRLSLSIGPETE